MSHLTNDPRCCCGGLNEDPGFCFPICGRLLAAVGLVDRKMSKINMMK